jgi:hypothetical protein
VRNLLAKLPERERERVRLAYWQALDDPPALARRRGAGRRRWQLLLKGANITAWPGLR